MVFHWFSLPECWLGVLTALSLFPLSLRQRQLLLSFFAFSILGNLYSLEIISNPWFSAQPWGQGFRGLVLLFTLALLYNNIQSNPERFALIALTGWTSALMCLTTEFMTFFVLMEIQTLCLFVLISYQTYSALSTEAAVKYFVLGAFVSGLFLFGLALFYQTRGHLSFHGGLNHWLVGESFPVLLITGTLFFKMTVAPFHQWAPDVYEGSPWVTLLVLSSLPKLGIFSVLAQLALPLFLLWVAGLISIFWGVWGAFNQSKLKRLLAYSAIGHAGFIIMGLSLGTLMGYQMAGLYLIFYIITFLTLVWVLETLPFLGSHWVYWAGLRSAFPIHTWILVFLLFSMAGIPPLVGFLIKWGILTALVEAQYYITTLVVLLLATWAVGYYLRLIKQLTFEPSSSWTRWFVLLQKKPNSPYSLTLLSLGTFVSITSLVWPFWYIGGLHYLTWCIV
uniref:NADH:ubiquinone reductase (H(+)-translocating) n=1 Tax=Haliclystus antarcticus TaxID=654955 RepID=A0A173FZN3_HALAN|nr:NADH dehydrogenase subunit 2 [Haliclystus antarcticus]ANH09491.1 NADH dehydrogenase subunit 2 [Haliclystus antarcticus]